METVTGELREGWICCDAPNSNKSLETVVAAAAACSAMDWQSMSTVRGD